MTCEVIVRGAVGVMVHTTEEAPSTLAAICAVLNRPEVQTLVGPLKHADLTVLCRPVTWASARGAGEMGDGKPEMERKAAA